MRIALTGTHGTGKSTLLQELMRQEILQKIEPCFNHWHYKIFDGIGRQVHLKHKTWSEKNKQHYINWLYVYHHYSTHDFVASRTIYDTYAYSRLFQGRDFDRRLLDRCMHNVYYNYVFYLPIEFPLVDDGVRYTDVEFQKQHDRETKLIMDYWKIPYHTITGSLSERVEQVKNILGL